MAIGGVIVSEWSVPVVWNGISQSSIISAVKVICLNDKLSYEVKQGDQTPSLKGDISIPPSLNKTQMISYLSTKCTVVIEVGKAPYFVPPCASWSFIGDQKISLMQGSSDLVWEYVSPLTAPSRVFFGDSLYPSACCHPETVLFLETLKTQPLDARRVGILNRFTVVNVFNKKELTKKINEYFQTVLCRLKTQYPDLYAKSVKNMYGKDAGNVDIFSKTADVYKLAKSISTGVIELDSPQADAAKLRIQQLSSIATPFYIEIAPINEKSRIDNKVSISTFRWSVTLITHKGSEGNHALLVSEGINNGSIQNIPAGKYFMYRSHFKPPVSSKIVSPEELKYETRSEVWVASSLKIKKMLELIDVDVNNPLLNLSRLGSDSLLNPEGDDSCFTWAREKLKEADVKLPKSWFGKLFTRTKNYTAKPTAYTGSSVEEI